MFAVNCENMYWTKCVDLPINGIPSAMGHIYIYKCKFSGPYTGLKCGILLLKMTGICNHSDHKNISN